MRVSGYCRRDIITALAEAAAIEHGAGKETENMDGVQDEDARYRCQNPLCQKVLHNSFANYCEGSLVCQRYRALKLQCEANTDNSRARKIRRDLQMSSASLMRIVPSEMTHLRKSHNAEASARAIGGEDDEGVNMSFTIPRRKIPVASATIPPLTSLINASEVSPKSSLRCHKTQLQRTHEAMLASARGRKVQPNVRRKKRKRRATNPQLPVTRTKSGDVVANKSAIATARGTKRRRRVSFAEVVDFEPENTYRPPTATSFHPCATKKRKQQRSRGSRATTAGLGVVMTPDIRNRSEGGNGRYLQEVNCSPLDSIGAPTLNPGLSNTPQSELYGLQTYSRVGNRGSSVADSAPVQRGSYSRITPASIAPVVISSLSVTSLPRHDESRNPALWPKSQSGERTNRLLSVSDFGIEFNQSALSPPMAFERRKACRCPGECIHLPRRDVDSTARDSSGRMQSKNNNGQQTERRCRPGVPTRPVSTTYANVGGSIDDIGYDSAAFALPASQPATRPQRESPGESPVIVTLAAAAPTCSIETTYMEQSRSDSDCEAVFSFREYFLQGLLSQFIQKLPSQLEPVTNVPKMPRKLQWYLRYKKKIEHICSPYMHIEMRSVQLSIMVQGRTWLKLKGSSMAILLDKAIKTLRNEAVLWRELKHEVEKSLRHYRRRMGDNLDLSFIFLRAWNNFKSLSSATSLPRQANYFCGARLHHWTFAVGRVEIGSGSHVEKREAFRLAAIKSAEFLLNLNDGQNDQRWRPSSMAPEISAVGNAESELLVPTPIVIVDLTNELRFPVSLDTSQDPLATAMAKSDEKEAVIAKDYTDTDLDAFNRTGVSAPTELMDDVGILDSASTVAPEATSITPGLLGVPTPSWALENTPTVAEMANASRGCSMCALIWMRKPDNPPCRRCQLTRTHADVNLYDRQEHDVHTTINARDTK